MGLENGRDSPKWTKMTKNVKKWSRKTNAIGAANEIRDSKLKLQIPADETHHSRP